MYVYNLMVYLFIGYLFYFLFFGCEFILLIDFIFGIYIGIEVDIFLVDEWIFKYRKRLSEVIYLVIINIEKNV